jgi:hypothetical protein
MVILSIMPSDYGRRGGGAIAGLAAGGRRAE